MRVRDVVPGAVVAAVGVHLASAGFSIYLNRFGGFDDVYGPLGAVLAFLLVVYIAAIVLLLGACVTAAWPETATEWRTEGVDEALPLRSRLVRAARGFVVRDRQRASTVEPCDRRRSEHRRASPDRAGPRSVDFQVDGAGVHPRSQRRRPLAECGGDRGVRRPSRQADRPDRRARLRDASAAGVRRQDPRDRRRIGGVDRDADRRRPRVTVEVSSTTLLEHGSIVGVFGLADPSEEPPKPLAPPRSTSHHARWTCSGTSRRATRRR